MNIHFEDDAVDRVDKKSTFIHPALPGRIEIRMLENPGVDMLHDTLKNFTLEGAGWENALISKFFKGGMKEALIHAINNTVQPVLFGRLDNPDLPDYLIVEEDEAAEVSAESENEEEIQPLTEDSTSFADVDKIDI